MTSGSHALPHGVCAEGDVHVFDRDRLFRFAQKSLQRPDIVIRRLYREGAVKFDERDAVAGFESQPSPQVNRDRDLPFGAHVAVDTDGRGLGRWLDGMAYLAIQNGTAY